MKEFTPTDIREAWIVAPGMDEEFDRWLADHDARVWDEGYQAACDETPIGFAPDGPTDVDNPYRTEQVAAPAGDEILVRLASHFSRFGSRGIDYSRLADYANDAVGTTEEG